MGEMLGILLLGLVGWAFWQQRRQAELAWQYMRRYCQHHDLQLLSLARTHRALGHKPLRLLTYYQFGFSSDGRAIIRAALHAGLHVASVELPPHRLPPRFESTGLAILFHSPFQGYRHGIAHP